MDKKTLIAIALLILLGGGWYFFNNKENKNLNDINVNINPLNTTYRIENEKFTLINGKAEKEISPEFASKNTVTAFGQPSFGDIDEDGDEDAVLILVNNQGGSGTFYYATMAVNIDGQYKGTDSILLGDRIAPQTYYIINNKAIVNYADRLPNESFNIRPSQGRSLYLEYNPKNLNLIISDPEN
ncbi:MAG: hypothetical protein V1851_00480 [Patescibacteria group bacterium]